MALEERLRTTLNSKLRDVEREHGQTEKSKKVTPLARPIGILTFAGVDTNVSYLTPNCNQMCSVGAPIRNPLDFIFNKKKQIPNHNQASIFNFPQPTIARVLVGNL